MAAVDDLQFEEFADSATSLAANPDATTISIEDTGETPNISQDPQEAQGEKRMMNY